MILNWNLVSRETVSQITWIWHQNKCTLSLWHDLENANLFNREGFFCFQTPLRPPMNNQKNFKLHICILWSHVVTFSSIPGLSLILFIYGTPPKSAPARNCRKSPDILGDLWPHRKQFTKMELSICYSKSNTQYGSSLILVSLLLHGETAFKNMQIFPIFMPRERPFWNILCFIEQFHVPLQQDVELDIGS